VTTQVTAEPVTTNETISVVLTSAPTTSPPTTAIPTMKPTTAVPTMKPTTAGLTNSPATYYNGIIAAAPAAPEDDSIPTKFEVKAPGSITIEGVTCRAGTTVSSALTTSIETALKSSGCPSGTTCVVDMTKSTCSARRRMFRALSTSSVVVEFEAVLMVFCQQFD
jgi:hypothetical protein